MVSNTRCDTVENCAVLWGVYDANGWDINKKHYTFDISMLISEWTKYIEENYDMKFMKEN